MAGKAIKVAPRPVDENLDVKIEELSIHVCGVCEFNFEWVSKSKLVLK